MSKLNDLSGLIFGRLTVINRGPNAKNGKTTWHCRCYCGSTATVIANNLKSHTRSCGCLLKEHRLTIKKTAFKNLEVNAGVKFIRDYERCAIKRGLVWELSAQEALNLALDKCHYCGVPPSNPAKIYDTRKGAVRVSKLLLNGIDRKDNTIGYVINNSVPCCKICNYAKRTLSYKEFIDYLDRVVCFRGAHATTT